MATKKVTLLQSKCDGEDEMPSNAKKEYSNNSLYEEKISLLRAIRDELEGIRVLTSSTRTAPNQDNIVKEVERINQAREQYALFMRPIYNVLVIILSTIMVWIWYNISYQTTQ